MFLNELFEDSDDISLRDPRANFAVNKARAQYGQATSDLEAFILMMADQENE